MIKKAWRLAKALWKETLKRVPWIVAILVVLFFAGWYKSYRKTAEGVGIARSNTQQIKQTQDTESAILENIDKGTKDNKALNQQTRDYVRCIATIFATFTQDMQPITIKDLDKCTITQGDNSTSPPARSSIVQHPTTNSKNTNNKIKSSSTSSGGNDKTGPVENQCSINLLFIHLNCKASAQ